MNPTAGTVKKELQRYADPKRAVFVAGYFKTGKGEYAEGDVFLGLRVPQVREVAKKFGTIPLGEAEKLLHSMVHEHRQAALMILVRQFAKGAPGEKKAIYDLYLKNTRHINNWDLVDGSAPAIVGGYLREKKGERKILLRLARSKSVWERRIAILSSWAFVRSKGDTRDLVAIATVLLSDTHDLIHKAVGWMLREMGKTDEKQLYSFLDKHAHIMPRTMLRYSIERLSPATRRKYLSIRAKK
jgi:3-methyladenine DNA glycosylase AlkD